MMKARMVHAGGANTGIVSTRRAAANAARKSTTLELYSCAIDYIAMRVRQQAQQGPIDGLLLSSTRSRRVERSMHRPTRENLRDLALRGGSRVRQRWMCRIPNS